MNHHLIRYAALEADVPGVEDAKVFLAQETATSRLPNAPEWRYWIDARYGT